MRYVPAGQDVQADAPAVAAYCPAAHVKHFASESCAVSDCVASDKYLPTTQAVQVGAPDALHVPAPHTVQSASASWDAATNAASERYFPATHDVQGVVE